MSPQAFVLSAGGACAYLQATGRLPSGPCRATPLGGGVSSAVVLVEAAGARWVLKQALPRLRVAADWRADPGRSRVEARALALLGRVLPPGAVPELVFEDAERHVVAMTAAPPGAENLKAVLLAGRVDLAAVEAAGALLGRLQAATRAAAGVRAGFADKGPFRQLRLDPYYEEVARRHPDLARAVRALARAALRAEDCLVHGDYSPKNFLVDRRGGLPGRLTLVDMEVCHAGARAFDPAFFLNHLLLKAVHRPALAGAFREAARRFWCAYAPAAGWPDRLSLEREVRGHLGCLLLARVDGKSPVEYIDRAADRARVRALARALLAGAAGGAGA